jgi:hypothetical protein
VSPLAAWLHPAPLPGVLQKLLGHTRAWPGTAGWGGGVGGSGVQSSDPTWL